MAVTRFLCEELWKLGQDRLWDIPKWNNKAKEKHGYTSSPAFLWVVGKLLWSKSPSHNVSNPCNSSRSPSGSCFMKICLQTCCLANETMSASWQWNLLACFLRESEAFWSTSLDLDFKDIQSTMWLYFLTSLTLRLKPTIACTHHGKGYDTDWRVTPEENSAQHQNHHIIQWASQ